MAKGLEESSGHLRVAGAMTRDGPVANEHDLLERVMNEMQQGSCAVVPVVRGERLVGLIDTENVGELLMIRSALRDSQPARRPKETAAV